MSDLSDKQVKAAYLLAHGREHIHIIEAVSVHKTTFYRWLKNDSFNSAVAAAAAKAAALIEPSPEEAEKDLFDAKSDDRRILAIQREIVDELSEFSLELIKHIRSEGVESVSPRMMPNFLKTLIEAINAMQNTTDRLIGIEALINDIEKVESALSIAEGESEGC
ncbi:MAG: hypothetical protein ACFB0D_16225 [Phormidesmis sp.]